MDDYYARYYEGYIDKIEACEYCGEKRYLHTIKFFEAIAIECDNCKNGKVLWKDTTFNSLNQEQIIKIDEIIEEALNTHDKEGALYIAKSKIRKINT